ncbi:DUF2878 domain-containing protein [Pseudomonadota bacterium]
MPPKLLLTNILLFQVGWFACVLGGANAQPWTGTAIALAIILIHLWLAADLFAELKLIMVALLIGLIFESSLVAFQLVDYTHVAISPELAPIWMIMLWGLFATTLNVSLNWLKNISIWWVGLIAFTFAPLAYFSGARLGAISFDDNALSLGVIALGWSILFPLMVLISTKLSSSSINSRTEAIS